MRAELTAEGTLRITPESGLEAFALAQWNAGRTKRKGKGTVLEVGTVVSEQCVTIGSAPWGLTNISPVSAS